MNRLTVFSDYKTVSDIDLHICQNQKFKTNLLQIYITQPLIKETASGTALIPYILYRGSTTYPTNREIVLKLDSLYGASLNVSVLKRGENQLVSFSLEVPNEKYLPDREPLFEKALDFLYDIVFNPLVVEEGFKGDYVDQEKKFLEEEIKSLINDKFNYSQERCYQEMCRHEPFGIYKLGDIETLPQLDRYKVYNLYSKLIKNNPINMFVVGDIDEEKTYYKINEKFSIKRYKKIDDNSTEVVKEINAPREVTEELNVNQGKLVIGFRTGITRGDKLYNALLFYNGILGRFPHSKLFQNVREKASLAYYAFSRLESTKGLLTINAGIDFKNYDKAREIILKQMDEISNGNISSDEFEWTKKGIINNLKTMADSNKGLVRHYLLGLINNKAESISDMIYGLRKVTVDDIVEVSKNIKIDTIYFLKKKGA
ncbi:EF-P 5-aminopentanol modification-associated protein YfmF [Halothermothrix orenii]|uniref:Peptidase M16 domain protein n=1 Tax=Halothermothrix orenii (strain H 168 / OCM 544 / DSM 9562) TaxID=373903 RepID=B8CX08_HALOH|nr:pitrilysin family protein [Halothermothrix orenii]ACL69827.1 peptidase M16 domain protein [Halothermothrix orenii H 168]